MRADCCSKLNAVVPMAGGCFVPPIRHIHMCQIRLLRCLQLVKRALQALNDERQLPF